VKYNVSKVYSVTLPLEGSEAYVSLVDTYVQYTSEDNSDSLAFMKHPEMLALEFAQHVDDDTDFGKMLVSHKLVTEVNWETEQDG